MKNKKKKQLPLLLLALLFITTAAYGTRAYFTDQATQNSNIKLTLGTLNIDSDDASWYYKGLGNSTLGYTPDMLISTEEISKVQPGDSFIKTFKFKNNGSLTQEVKITNDFIVNDEPFVVSVNNLKINDSNPVQSDYYTLTAGDTISIDVTISVPIDTMGNFGVAGSYNTDLETYVYDAITDAVSVSAQQTNVPK
jgi:hypothetical protein